MIRRSCGQPLARSRDERFLPLIVACRPILQPRFIHNQPRFRSIGMTQSMPLKTNINRHFTACCPVSSVHPFTHSSCVIIMYNCKPV